LTLPRATPTCGECRALRIEWWINVSSAASESRISESVDPIVPEKERTKNMLNAGEWRREREV
jgi:hypothetical protein